jgi:thiol-disulfide isomerase/thioredoxin
MKKLSFLCFLLVFFFACNQPSKYVILGEVTNSELEDFVVQLYSVDSIGNASLLSADTIRENKFSFSGVGAGLVYIEMEDGSELWKRYLLLDSGEIRVVIGNDIVVSGTRANNDYQEALNAEIRLDELEAQYYEEKEKGLTAEREKELDKNYDEQFENVKALYTAFFRNNIHNPLGQEIFTNSRWTRRLNPDQLESVLGDAGDSFKKTDAYQTNSERLHNMKTSTPGNKYKDIVSKDTKGNAIALSDYVGKGKYVLLDFWASWCPPCREEMPNLVKLYNQYKSKKFEIVAYSLDKNAEAWQKGIRTLKMSWPQMSDCAYWDSPAVKLYAVQGIPCTILIDPEGNIIKRDLRGKELAETLKDLVK